MAQRLPLEHSPGIHTASRMPAEDWTSLSPEGCVVTGTGANRDVGMLALGPGDAPSAC